jgi:hypothetical protein
MECSMTAKKLSKIKGGTAIVEVEQLSVKALHNPPNKLVAGLQRKCYSSRALFTVPQKSSSPLRRLLHFAFGIQKWQ